mmetsp:Transcript_44284/g.94262  ORF Transcript_44284/g.94262 Transcript_44284/m.94262 type:complete len:200 (+) Transcript_44284:1071-1670(+)
MDRHHRCPPLDDGHGREPPPAGGLPLGRPSRGGGVRHDSPPVGREGRGSGSSVRGRRRAAVRDAGGSGGAHQELVEGHGEHGEGERGVEYQVVHGVAGGSGELALQHGRPDRADSGEGLRHLRPGRAGASQLVSRAGRELDIQVQARCGNSAYKLFRIRNGAAGGFHSGSWYATPLFVDVSGPLPSIDQAQRNAAATRA